MTVARRTLRGILKIFDTRRTATRTPGYSRSIKADDSQAPVPFRLPIAAERRCGSSRIAHIDMATTAPDVIRDPRPLMCLWSKGVDYRRRVPEAVAINPIR